MRQDYTHVSILLDRSGSMASIASDVIGGFNRFIHDQKQVPGKMTLTLAQFDTEYDVIKNMVDIHKVEDLSNLTFVPRGSTALLDSAARLIADTGKALAEMPEHERPAKVVFLMITDGGENASVRITREKLKEMTELQQNVYKWNFQYIGANQDSFAQASAFGVHNTANFLATSVGARAMFKGASASMTSYRADTNVGAKYAVSQEDIEKAEHELLNEEKNGN